MRIITFFLVIKNFVIKLSLFFIGGFYIHVENYLRKKEAELISSALVINSKCNPKALILNIFSKDIYNI
jgi:hypothetical protein